MKVLVSVASRHGATDMIGDCIREELEATGVTAHQLEPGMVADISQYDGIVIGSAVYGGRWLRPARKLVDRYEAQLRTKPVWLFSSGPLGDPPRPSQPPAEGLELTRRLNAIDHQVFEGRLERDTLGIGERLAVRAMHAPTGDYREWPAITAWARSISAALKADLGAPAGTPAGAR
jgi:menaquinone-dependent protoporphyrinogen oxidase